MDNHPQLKDFIYRNLSMQGMLGSRPVSTRVYQDSSYTNANETPAQIASAIAAMKPSWVGTWGYFASKVAFTSQMVTDFQTTRATLGSSVKISLCYNAKTFPSDAQAIADIDSLVSTFNPDLVEFDYWDPLYISSPTIALAAVAECHKLGKAVAGHVSHSASLSQITPGTDIVVTTDSNFQLPTDLIQQMYQTNWAGKVYVRLNNNPQQGTKDEGYTFIVVYNDAQKLAYLTSVFQAANASKMFWFFAPCQYPLYPARVSWDTINDDNMVSLIAALMDQYDYGISTQILGSLTTS